MSDSPRYTTRLFESLDALADFASGCPNVASDGDDWAGGTFASALRRTRDGDLALAAESEALLAKLESLQFPTRKRQWIADVSGHVPNVPAFIAGHPAAMRRRVKREHEAAPVTVFVDLFASASFTPSEVRLRGAAVLALVRVLAAYRPVSLYVAFASASYKRSDEAGCIAARINTTPLDLAHAAWALCGVGFLRRVLFAALDATFPSYPFPAFRGELRDIAAEMLPHGEHVVAVSGVVSDVTRNPQAWVLRKLREAAPEVLGGSEAA